MRGWGFLIFAIIFFVVGVLGLLLTNIGTWRWCGRLPPTGPGYRFPRPVQFKSIGERIYYTGAGESGDPIPFTRGPRWVYMHGASCVNCHGLDGKGGIRVHMTGKIATDIRYSTLASRDHEHPPYTDELIKRAITQGLDSAGKPLDRSMPRWRMSDRDLNHLIEYLRTLDRKQEQ